MYPSSCFSFFKMLGSEWEGGSHSLYVGGCLTNRELNCSDWVRLNLLLNIFIKSKLFLFFYKGFYGYFFLFFQWVMRATFYFYLENSSWQPSSQTVQSIRQHINNNRNVCKIRIFFKSFNLIINLIELKYLTLT